MTNEAPSPRQRGRIGRLASSITGRVRTPAGRRVGIALLLVAILSVPSAAALYVYREHRAAVEGDYVTFHITAYDRDGVVRYTTDPALAEDAIAHGNTYLNANLSDPVYGVRGGLLSLAPTASEGIAPSRYLVGTHPGDVVRTPLTERPFGSAERSTIPLEIGPVAARAVVPEDRIAFVVDDAWDSRTGVPEPYTGSLDVGTSLLYAGTLPAMIVAREDGNVTLEVDAKEGDRVFSRALGFNLTVHPLGTDEFVLRPALTEGETFVTRRCSLPIELQPGRYRVISVDGDKGHVVEAAPERLEPLRGESLVVEFQVVDVNTWPEVLRAKVAMRQASAQIRLAWADLWGDIPPPAGATPSDAEAS